jgi:hypothetical protein
MELIDRCNALDHNEAVNSHQRRYATSIADMINTVLSGSVTKAQMLEQYQSILNHIGGTDANLAHPSNEEVNAEWAPIKEEVDSIIEDFKIWLNS